jgi:hypothetical protein
MDTSAEHHLTALGRLDQLAHRPPADDLDRRGRAATVNN